MGCRGGRGRSPKGQASLPREQEAEPRPADLLLEVRGLGRPSRPHFLQPRPTPCGPRVYGNSGQDGFSEIIFSLCPRLTPPAPKGTQAGRPERCGEGTEPFPGGPWPRSDPFPEISFLNVALPVQIRVQRFTCRISSWGLGAIAGDTLPRRNLRLERPT